MKVVWAELSYKKVTRAKLSQNKSNIGYCIIKGIYAYLLKKNV